MAPGFPQEAPATEPAADAAAVAPAVSGAAQAAKEKAADVGIQAEAEAPAEMQSEASVPERAAAQKPTVRYLSADDSNSAAFPVIARKIIRSGRAVQPAIVRTYEFLNYYSFDYDAPAQQPVRIIPQLRALEGGSFSLQVAVRAQDRSLGNLPPFSLTILLDTSGSMAGEPLDLARAMIQGIFSRLRPEDRISLITCNRRAEVVLSDRPVESLSAPRLVEILRSIRADDVTDLEAGIAKAYETAGGNYDYRSLNRVVLISDGAANTGQLAAETIAEYAEDSDRQGIYLAGIGVGEGFNDQLMNTVTDKGRGAYLFVDSESEVRRILEEDTFIASFDLAVKDVRLKMVMPGGWKMEEFHGEQVSARAEDIVPQYLSPNDQMIYHLEVSADKPVEELRSQEFEFEVEYVPIGGRRDRLTMKSTVGEMLSSERARQILKGDAVVAYAEMLKSIQLPLDANQQENLEVHGEAVMEIARINDRLSDPELEEILALLELYGETLRFGEKFPGSRDGQESSPDAVLGLRRSEVRSVMRWEQRIR
jgi:Ca-activated chloride channel family protein